MRTAIAETFRNVRRRGGGGRRRCGGASRPRRRSFPSVCSVFLGIGRWVHRRGEIARRSTRFDCRFAPRLRTRRLSLRDCCRAHIGPFHPAARPPTDVRPMQRTIRCGRRPILFRVQTRFFTGLDYVRETTAPVHGRGAGRYARSPRPRNWGGAAFQLRRLGCGRGLHRGKRLSNGA